MLRSGLEKKNFLSGWTVSVNHSFDAKLCSVSDGMVPLEK